ncbi:MAG: hypothetical protein DYG89_40625 [Caldilinea sp. CFX5]|nr:hypothetical protein [Caldilinea sp. CFX5]
MGDYTLCDKCNNDTGAWYGKRFVDWCYQGMDILIRANGRPSLIYMHYLLPLSIIKQVVTMFLAINSPRFTNANEELVRFILNKDAKYLSPKYRFFVYFNVEGRFRRAGLTGKVDTNTGRVAALSELSFTPFGYVMTLDAPPPDERLLEITHFARYEYNEFAVQELRLPVLPTHLALPGDYRTKQEIQEDFQRNMQAIPEL